MSSGRVRAFVALDLGPVAREGIAALIEALRPRVPGARFVAASTLHLTLRFLGDSTPEQIERVAVALGKAAARCAAFEAAFGELGVFPPRGAPRVLWLSLPLPGPACALQEDCERVAVEAGFPRETRGFRAHVTLARFRERVRTQELPGAPAVRARVERLVLFASELRPAGALHTELRSFALAASGLA